MKNENVYITLAWAAVLLLLAAAAALNGDPSQQAGAKEVSFSQLLDGVDAGQVRDVIIRGQRINGTFNDGRQFSTYALNDPTLVNRLYSRGIAIKAGPPENIAPFASLLFSSLPLFFVIALLIGRQGRSGEAWTNPFGLGTSRAKLLSEQGRVTFEDVAGIDETRAEVEEIVEFLRDPSRFQQLGARIPRGVLLVGSPGTGKTLIARALAGEANVPFFTTSGSGFVELFVGVGASRVRDLFERAKKAAPCIVFIDEIDAVGRHRGAGLGGGNDEREQTLNQLLVAMDGFEVNSGIVIVAATNRVDVLDAALLRPGRFDRQIVIQLPDLFGREKILKVHTRQVPLAGDANLKAIARGTPGFSGADLMNLVNEAALGAARLSRLAVTQEDFEAAKDRVLMGSERKSLVMTEEERALTAYHEGGHAIVALSVAAADPVHKTTIVPRGRALGMVLQLPERDHRSMSYEQMTARLAIMMGGRVAEEIIFGANKITSGAESDIKQATHLARMMVTRWGLSPALGMVAYGETQDEVFLGRSFSRRQILSQSTARIIDMEIKRLVDEGYGEARRILEQRHSDLERLANRLLECETLSGGQIVELLERGDRTAKGKRTALPALGETNKRKLR